MDTLNPYYNIAKVANSMLGYRHTVKDRIKMSRIKGGKKIKVYTIDGDYVGIFETQRECANKLEIKQHKISMCLTGKR